MTEDPDELKHEHWVSDRDPAIAIAAIQEIEVTLRYGLPVLKFIGWTIIVLQALILWRLW